MSRAVFLFLIFVFIFIFINLSEGRQMPRLTTDADEISGKSFDYIVVGGGTAGCPLAATLSEKFSVLVIERGDSPYGNQLVEQIKWFGYSWLETDKYSSVTQEFTSRDGIKNLRGRVLGGSSAINGAFYSRASGDFVKQAGWDKELIREAYEWVESKVVFTPEITQWQSVVRSAFLEAGIYPYNGYSLEHIRGTKMGGSIYDRSGKRHSSADLLGAGKPDKITVLLNTTVKTIIFDGEGNETRATGVRFIRSDGSSEITYEAHIGSPAGNVILSAGALGSPQILLLSGIGPEKHLKNFNISVVIDHREVGSRMADNPAIALLVDRYPQNQNPGPVQVAAIAEDLILESLVFPTNLSSSLTRISIGAKIAFPQSKGRLKLASTDPRQNPSVIFNYLKSKKDLEGCVDMVLLLQHVARTKSVAAFMGPQEELILTRDAELRSLCKKNVWTYYHYHGGCVVGSVVDKDYRVHGVKGLRVVDGSTFGESPGTNPMATVLMLGRYQGIQILRERNDDQSN